MAILVAIWHNPQPNPELFLTQKSTHLAQLPPGFSYGGQLGTTDPFGKIDTSGNPLQTLNRGGIYGAHEHYVQPYPVTNS